MSGPETPVPGRPALEVADRALAVIAAHAAAGTPGVARLHPYALNAARAAAASAARRVGATLTGRDDPRPRTAATSAADTDAIDVEHHDGGAVTVGVRIVAGTEPPVRQTAQDVARTVSDGLWTIAGVQASVRVHIVDVDAGPARW